MLDEYKDALDEVFALATKPYKQEVVDELKNKSCFNILKDACEKAERFDAIEWTAAQDNFKAKWHIVKEKDLPKYSSDDYLIVTKYVDNCDYPYTETTVARFYRLSNDNYMWLDGCGEYVNVVAWRELPEEFSYKAYLESKIRRKNSES